MKHITVPAIKLCVISFICAMLLGICSEVTKPAIAQQKEKTQKETMQAVLPVATEFKELKDVALETEMSTSNKVKIASVFKGYEKGVLCGYVINVQPSGFGGTIDTMVGMDAEGSITGLRILSLSETPGLGVKATEPAFYEQYTGKSQMPLEVIKSGTPGENQIQAITSATITSDAVTLGANVAADWYQEVGRNE